MKTGSAGGYFALFPFNYIGATPPAYLRLFASTMQRGGLVGFFLCGHSNNFLPIRFGFFPCLSPDSSAKPWEKIIGIFCRNKTLTAGWVEEGAIAANALYTFTCAHTPKHQLDVPVCHRRFAFSCRLCSVQWCNGRSGTEEWLGRCGERGREREREKREETKERESAWAASDKRTVSPSPFTPVRPSPYIWSRHLRRFTPHPKLAP